MAEVICDWISNIIANKIRKPSRSSPKNSLETVESEANIARFDKEIPKEIYLSPEICWQLKEK